MVRKGCIWMAVLLLAGLCAHAEALHLVEAPVWREDAYVLAVSQRQADSVADRAPLGVEDGLALFALSEDEVRELSEELDPLSVSPDGQAVLLSEGYVLRGNRLIRMLPDGAFDDEYGKLELYMRAGPAELTGINGANWSPDGRYLMLTNADMALQRGRFLYDVTVWDTMTGEIHVLDSYGLRFRDSDAGTVFQAKFDRSGEYLYYCTWGGDGAFRLSLSRVRLETGQIEVCYNGPKFAAWPALEELGEGQWMHLNEQMGTQSPGGFNVYTWKGTWWQAETRSFPWAYEAWYPEWMGYGEAARCALVVGTMDLSASALVRVEVDGWRGMDRLWIIEDLDSSFATRLGAPSGEADGVDIAAARISPEGDRAVLWAVQDGVNALLMLDLKTMALDRLEMEGGAELCWAPEYVSNCAGGLDWCDDGSLLIRTGDGLRRYRLA